MLYVLGCYVKRKQVKIIKVYHDSQLQSYITTIFYLKNHFIFMSSKF